MSDEIIKKLDKGFKDGKSVDCSIIGDASFLMWLWTLGAYEIVRTISQAKKCFNPEFIKKINRLKQELAVVRMPNSKMEKKGEIKPVNSNRSPDGWDIESKDLLIGDPENFRSARMLIELYDKTICSIDVSDVLAKHKDSY